MHGGIVVFKSMKWLFLVSGCRLCDVVRELQGWDRAEKKREEI